MADPERVMQIKSSIHVANFIFNKRYRIKRYCYLKITQRGVGIVDIESKLRGQAF